jgi:hypothetical protein
VFAYSGNLEGVFVRIRIIVLQLVAIGIALFCSSSNSFCNAGGVQATMEKEIKVCVDRIEEGLAVLVVWDDHDMQLEWPVSLLPESIREGSVLSISVSQDEQTRSETRDKVSGLLQKLIQKGK